MSPARASVCRRNGFGRLDLLVRIRPQHRRVGRHVLSMLPGLYGRALRTFVKRALSETGEIEKPREYRRPRGELPHVPRARTTLAIYHTICVE